MYTDNSDAMCETRDTWPEVGKNVDKKVERESVPGRIARLCAT